MAKAKKAPRRNKGVSPLFISLYLALITVLLISTLFVALGISRAALTERLRVEQDRMQEIVVLAGPDALELLDGSIVKAIRVNNTGSITVRIRALYIDHNFICDPSEFENDSYIEPKGSLWIRLFPNVNPPIILNDTTLNAYWTVTTERGTKASETGANLMWPPWEPYTPNRFYFGPLMLIFDMFHWRSGTGPWINGWTIPKGTKDVTWRILLVNVDNRDIAINETSCLTLISNDNAPKDPLPWYIDPTLSTTIFKPGKFNFVYYSWSKPFSEGGSSRQGVTGMTKSTTCINFLTFHGSFIEPNGTMPFGQTIPFEAVLITDESMAASLTLTSNPENIKNDGISTSTITARVKDGAGKPLADAWVDFYTTRGTLSTERTKTDANGVATVTLRSSTSQATANVIAMCQGVQGNCKVVFTPASRIAVTAVPNVISRNGTSKITVQLVDSSNSNVAQSDITITIRVTSWTGNPPSQPTLSSVTVTTDSSGSEIVTLTAQGRAGTATITASASGLLDGSATVQVQ